MSPRRRGPSSGASLLLAGVAIAAVHPASATESGFSHYIPGVLAGPGAGIVPPEPGLYWLNAETYYYGSARGSVPFPVAGRLQLGLKVDFFAASFGAVYVPRLDLGPFTLGFGVNIPVGYARGEVLLGNRSRAESNVSLGDIIFTPLLLGYRNNGHFLQGRLDVTAPTGAYQEGGLDNIGLNYWTFSPTFAYTYLRPGLLDFSVTAGVDVNTRNPKTDYTSGALVHLDTALTFDVGGGFGVGVLGAMLYQISDDSGGLADRLNGFRGRSFTVGPIARYAFQLGQTHLNATLAWAPEFGVRNRTEGGSVLFRLSGRF